MQAQYPNAVCIGSDTMVTIDGLRLGKPKDADEAASMLRRLRGRTHEVLTGLAVLTPDGGAHTLHTCTRVTFRDFAEDELAAYLATGEPLDKAGAYGSGPRRTAHRGHRGRLLQQSWVCLWLRFIPFCAIFMRYKPHLPAEIPHFSATL